MPLLLNPSRTPPQWAARKNGNGTHLVDARNVIKIALINNMPDAALEDTELQFFELLESSSGTIPVEIELYSLPGLQRGERARSHLDRFYSSTDDLGDRKFDGAIITGTEPRQPDLRDEPYWPALGRLFDWAERNTASTVLSCLAAHAGVLYSDGIERQPLSDKKFGVFGYARSNDHNLLFGVGDLVRFPHSRWNEVRAEALTSCGYTVLTESQDAGVDMFVKKKHASLFVHFQGHPEYGASTLLKEYRRDIKRFLRKERPTYPSMPYGYFDTESLQVMAEFRERVSRDPLEEHMESFPDAYLMGKVEKTWQTAALSIYQNWLRYMAAKKSERRSVTALAQAG
jgi:homoserine O-succinyltransferase